MRERGVILKVDEENNLDIDAPKGVLEQSFVEAIRSRKQELLDYLRNITHNAGAEGSIPRAPVLPAYDLSSSQMNVWITNEIWDDHTVNNIDTTMVWTADFDPVKFEHAVQAMIERHEILRTVFREDGNGKVMQVVLPPEQVDFRLSYFDFRYEQDRYEKREILLREDANKPFNLRTGPLLRVTLYRLEEETYYIHPTMHHIISDGWSLTVLIREVFIYYEALIKGEPAALEPLRIHYKDYAAWQQEQLHTEKFREHQLYWTARFRESWQLLDLFAGNVRPAVQTINGRVLRTVINETLATRLKEFCLKQKGSLFMGLVALLRVFLYRYTGQKDLVLGTPVAGRNHPDLHNQIGYYINTLALRTPLQEGDTFTGLFDRVRTDVMNAFEHQDYPFNKLLEDIAVKRDLSRNALFDIMIGLQNFSDNPDHNYAAAGMEDAIEDWGYSRPRYDLFFEFIEMGNELDMRLEFNTDIYDKAAMHRLIAHYKCLLEALLAQPSAPVAEVDYLSPAERKQLLTAFNDTAVVYPADKTMLDLFAAQVEQRPSGIAVVDEEGNAISYQELDERASALARYLRSCGVQQETLVPLLQERSVELIVSMLAVLKAGGAYLPIDPSYPQERVAYMLSDTGAGLIIAHSKYARLLEAQETLHRVYIDRDRALPDNLHEVLPPQVQPSGLAYIIYTSGSTGQPKGVMITHTSVVNLVHWHINRYDVKPGAHATAMLGPGFDAFALEVWSALLSGAALYIVGDELKLDPAALLDFYKANGITHTFVPTALVQGLVSQEQPEGLLLKYVLIGGDRLPEVAIGHLSYTLVNQYGPTESTVMVTDYPILEQTGKQPPVGKPLWNTYVRILDSHQGLVPVGVAGELCIGGVQLARGYLNKPELTASRFISDPYLPGERLYRTGDQARWLPDGNIAFIGRIDDQVKIRGYRIEPGDVEHGLLRVPGIRAAVVKVVFEENGAASLAGYFTSEEPLSPAQVRAQLSGHLPAYMVPAYLVEVEGFTLTPNGKVDKDCLPHPSELGLVSGVEYVAPVNAVEHALAEVYGEVLKRERVSVQDSFFDLGGDSIKAILLINRLKQRGYTVKVGDVLKYPVIAEVAKHTRVVTPEAPENNKPLQEGFTYRQLLPEELEAICSAGEVSDIYELSPLQEGIYYHWLAEPGTTAYVQQTSYRMKGALQVKVIQESYEYLVARHAVLRTSFSHEYGSRNLQIVRKQVQAGFIYQDIGNLEDKEAYVTHYKQQDRKKGFDLGSGSQMRLSVLDLGGEEYELVWSHHHILMDGWCATVLINEFYVIYQYLLNDRPPLLDKPAAYVNYIRWLFRQDKARSLQYWKEYLAAYGSLAAIPFREKAQEGTPYVLAETHLMLDAEKLAAIQAVCRQAEVTENTFVQSAWAYLLSCYNHTQDVVFGAVVSGRPGELDGVDTMMGLFINTIPVRIAYDDSTTARSLLKKVQQEAIASLPYHYLQLSEIQAESPLGNKLFDHVLGFLNYPEELNIPGTAAETGGLEKLELLSQDAVNESNYDFNIITFLVPGGMWVIFRYNAAVYSAASVQRIKEHFAGVLEGFMTGADSPLTAMDYLPAGERHQLLYDFNDTAFPYPDAQSIPDLFAGWVERVGDSAALVHEGRTLSYRELDEQSNQLAHYLQRQGVGEGSVVPVLLDRSLELVLSLLAVLKAGGAYVPVDPAYPAERISYMLSDTGSRLLLTHSYYTDLLE
ncbi:non-ribosomal peptide synthetase, partial [Chitinophaga japonensis]